jgi:hypothetical protein
MGGRVIINRIPVLETFPWQPPVKQLGVNTPPFAALKGDRYVVGTSPTGAWVGHVRQIAYCSNVIGPVWSFDIPVNGWQVFSVFDAANYYYNGSIWSPVVSQTASNTY